MRGKPGERPTPGQEFPHTDRGASELGLYTEHIFLNVHTLHSILNALHSARRNPAHLAPAPTETQRPFTTRQKLGLVSRPWGSGCQAGRGKVSPPPLLPRHLRWPLVRASQVTAFNTSEIARGSTRRQGGKKYHVSESLPRTPQVDLAHVHWLLPAQPPTHGRAEAPARFRTRKSLPPRQKRGPGGFRALRRPPNAARVG